VSIESCLEPKINRNRKFSKISGNLAKIRVQKAGAGRGLRTNPAKLRTNPAEKWHFGGWFLEKFFSLRRGFGA